MQESYSEGLAIHTGPESCGHLREGMPEALTGVHAGRVLSRVSSCVTVRSADAVENVGRQHCTYRYSQICTDSARSQTPCTHESFSHRNWEIPCLTSTKNGNEVRTVNPEGARR